MPVAPRISNPTSVSSETVKEILERGARPTIQFSAIPVSSNIFNDLNKLCLEFGDALEVRFYGFYGESFDAITLKKIPDVQWLSLDCLDRVVNVDELFELKNIKKLSFGVYDFDDPDFLSRMPLERLISLNLSENRKRNFNLSYLTRCERLTDLGIVGHTREIQAVASIPRLTTLALNSIARRTGLEFLSSAKALRSLTFMLGGRPSIEEFHLDGLEQLRVIRVQGLETLGNLQRFPQLSELHVEDQIQISEIAFPPLPIRDLTLINCKKLAHLHGLSNLSKLKQVRIYKTELDLEGLLNHKWPHSLDVLALYSGKVKQDDAMRALLVQRGYREFRR